MWFIRKAQEECVNEVEINIVCQGKVILIVTESEISHRNK